MKKYWIGLASAFLLVACNDKTEEVTKEEKSLTATEVLERAEKAHEEVTAVEIQLMEREKNQGNERHAIEMYDFEAGIISIDYDDAELLYRDEEGLIVAGTPNLQRDQQIMLSVQMDNREKQSKNSFAHFKSLDEDFYSLFDMKETDESFVLTYNGDEDAQMKVMSNALSKYSEAMASELDRDIGEQEVLLAEFGAEWEIDKDTYLVQTVNMRNAYTIKDSGRNETVEVDKVYEYKHVKYNDDVGEIEKPSFLSEETRVSEWSEEEQAQYEQEAADYLDAMIQATVFQNAEEYAKRAPGSEEENKGKGISERDTFKVVYEQNTSGPIDGMDISSEQLEDEIEKVADGFLAAISHTEYEIVEARAIDDKDIEVLLTVRGIDFTSLEWEMVEQIQQEQQNGKIKDEESFVKRNLELQAERYQAISKDDLLPPTDIKVRVWRNPGGSYEVMQDSYLDGFAP
ncbi:DUF6612 family protein [Bacillus sp. FSL W7-1360]